MKTSLLLSLAALACLFVSNADAQDCGCNSTPAYNSGAIYGDAGFATSNTPMQYSAPVMDNSFGSNAGYVDSWSGYNQVGFSGNGYQSVVPSYRQVRARREVAAFPRTPFSSPPFFRASTNLPSYNARSPRFFNSGYSAPAYASPSYGTSEYGAQGCGCGG